MRIAVTGGPGAGKTTLLNALAARGYAIVPEVARRIIAERRSRGLSPRPPPQAFARDILSADQRQYESVGSVTGPVFFDRSVIDSLGMLYQAGGLPDTQRHEMLHRYRYHPTAFILPPWRDIYRTDTERDQSFDEAVSVYRSLRSWYAACGYALIDVPQGPVEYRCDFVIRHIERRAAAQAAVVQSVSSHPDHTFSKAVQSAIELVAGEGVAGDAHRGATVQHRSRVAIDPEQPNLRQVHLLHAELFAELHDKGFDVEPGMLGENITTVGLDLLGLPRHSELLIGSSAVVQVTGLRNPCTQLDACRPGLMEAVIERTSSGLVRKCGIMGVVLASGRVRAGDAIDVVLPPGPHEPLERV